jgi:hypothetical protein
VQNFVTRLFAFFLICSTLACSSTTLIRTTDSDAKIYIDGEYKGKGSVSYTDTKIVGSSTSVRVQKEGCEPQLFNLTRSEEFDAGACAGGVFFLVPFLWIERYKPEHTYEYTCEKTHSHASNETR